jgi:hypothetical protein
MKTKYSIASGPLRAYVSAVKMVLLFLSGIVPAWDCPAIWVTNLNDSGPGSLRAVIAAAASGDNIYFGQINGNWVSPLRGTITLTSGQLLIDKDLLIHGSGTTNLIIDGNALSRVFQITNAANVQISDLSISNGLAEGDFGGGIWNCGGCFLHLARCSIVNNSAKGNSSEVSACGGGIFSQGALNLDSCTISGNIAYGAVNSLGSSGEGGGICASGPTSLINSTVAMNLAHGGDAVDNGVPGGDAHGGGIWACCDSLTVDHCTISSNSAVSGDTVSYNWRPGPQATCYGGGVDVEQVNPSAAWFGNCLIAWNQVVAGAGAPPNSAYGPDVSSGPGISQPMEPVTSFGFNLIGQTNDSIGWVTSDLTGSTASPLNPRIGPLSDNGGPTFTMSPLPGSPAIDAGFTDGFTTDQRGFARPILQGGPLPPGGDGGDIGAVEVQKVTLVGVVPLVNGHFESPILAGDGVVWSTDPSFYLPGWTYPTDSNQCYLVHGQPTGSAQYADGRQALCLHGQGTPVSISQTFPTVPGQNYTLSFAQSDETNMGPSAAQLLVSVAGKSWLLGNQGTYHVYDDHGYVPQVLNFTAQSDSTTLTFTDMSPAGSPSPLLDAVCVNPASGLVAGSSTGIPGGGGLTYAGFSSPTVYAGLDRFSVFFFGVATNGYQGVWVADGYCGNGIPKIWPNPPPPNPLVDTATAIPGGSGTFRAFAPGAIAAPSAQPLPLSGSGGAQFLLWASGSGSAGQQGFYSLSGASEGQAGTLARYVDKQTTIPGRSETFANFAMLSPTNSQVRAPQIAADGGNTVFWGAGADGWEGVYCASVPRGPTSPPPSLLIAADLSTPVPGKANPFTTFVNPNLWQNPDPAPWRQLAINGNNILFYAASAGGGQGIYCAPVPSGTGGPSNLFTVVDTTMSPTNGCCQFTGFGGFDLASGSGRLSAAFIGFGPGGLQGIYDVDVPCGNNSNGVVPIPVPGPVWPIADTNTAIPQGVGNFTSFAGVACGGPYGIAVGFVGRGGNGQKGIYAIAAPNASGVSPFPLAKVIDLTDTLDGKSIADLQLAPGAINGLTLAYKAVFADGSQGLYTIPLVVNVAFTRIAVSADGVHLNFCAPPGRNYSLLSTTNLNVPWPPTNHVAVVVGGGDPGDLPGPVIPPGNQGANFVTVQTDPGDPGNPPSNVVVDHRP